MIKLLKNFFRVNPHSFLREAKQSASTNGFTLIEILVVASIIILLSSIVVLNYRRGGEQFALQRSANKLAQDIRKAQEMAMSTKELPGGGFPMGGYGVHFDRYVSGGETNYDIYLYADTTSPWERCDSGDQIIEVIYKEDDSIYLEKEVKIKEVKVNETSPDKVSINFKPPDPTIKLRSGWGVDYDNIIITIALKTDENKTKTIKVNKAGLIDVD